MNEYGFTNDVEELQAAAAFREAAVADGWSIYPTYGERESQNTHATLERDGFKMFIKARVNDYPKNHRYRYEVGTTVWGPDGLCVHAPKVYSMAAVRAGLRTCDSCKAQDVDTERYSFAGRCCQKCLPKMRDMHERPGWCD